MYDDYLYNLPYMQLLKNSMNNLTTQDILNSGQLDQTSQNQVNEIFELISEIDKFVKNEQNIVDLSMSGKVVN